MTAGACRILSRWLIRVPYVNNEMHYGTVVEAVPVDGWVSGVVVALASVVVAVEEESDGAGASAMTIAL